MRRLLPLLLLAIPAVSHAWWNDEWNFRKEITLDLGDSGARITGTALEVPVLVKLHAGNFGYFNDTKPDGGDLRFIAGDDKTALKFHVERYDPTSQLAWLWVRVPRLAGGTNTDKIYLYYGNTAATAGADEPGTYDADQTLVFHFSGPDATPVDETAYKNNASTAAAERNTASLIGAGLKFPGSGSISVPSTASLRFVPAEGATFSAWVRIDGAQANATVLSLQDAAGAISLGINGLQVQAHAGAVAAPVAAQSTTPLSTGQWHHLAISVAAGRLSLYVDGAEAGSAMVTVPAIAGALTIGAGAGGSNPLNGEVDEVQVSKVARPLEWLQAAARSQGQVAPLVVYGDDAQRESGDASYLVVTMKNVTIDGWVVIGILAVMFVIAMLIMIGKTVYLSRIAGANKAFLKEFQKLKGDPTALDSAESDEDEGDEALDRSAFVSGDDGGSRYRLSTLYRLYHHGVQEMTGRIGLRTVSAQAVTTLSPQAIEAIRATMDATMVRLTQKLQSQMVLLTIAISGGPFLGLLGTVVGVMITFAAIAASGDVNVNSIAPGIAAALAATVAGLAVAIPALFGYNWLNTKIKEVNADMRVFVDEFITRVAEHYS